MTKLNNSQVDRIYRKKILFCYVEYHHYRVPIWQELSKLYDVTVLHASAPKTDGTQRFREISSPPYKIWRFRYQPGMIREVRTGNYDAVIFFSDVAWFSSILGFLLCPPHTRRITWGFWMTKSKAANCVRAWLAKRADGNVFYATRAARDFLDTGVSKSKIWIARNSVHVDPAERTKVRKRETILFLGSFVARKRNDITISAFDAVCAKIPEHIRLVLVGDGPAKATAQAQADALPNGHRIDFHPGTIDPSEIQAHYAHALCSVSFGQAGLSVLQSFGHGVPFITSESAISGGEIENIISEQTGILCDMTQSSLEDSFLAICNDHAYSEQLGYNALRYYKRCSSADIMAAGFIEAIENKHSFTERVQ